MSMFGWDQILHIQAMKSKTSDVGLVQRKSPWKFMTEKNNFEIIFSLKIYAAAAMPVGGWGISIFLGTSENPDPSLWVTFLACYVIFLGRKFIKAQFQLVAAAQN